MSKNTSIFEKTYENYLKQIAAIDLKNVTETLGAQFEKNSLIISLYGKAFRISQNGIMNLSGIRPSLDICVILCQYILRCPPFPPKPKDWVSFRDFKDSGPLTVYWRNDVEKPIATAFSKKRESLEKSGRKMDGYDPVDKLPYDLVMQFDALPKIPLLMMFNDADEEFPAQCSLLFQKRAEAYLDAESLAILGQGLAIRIIGRNE